MIRCGVGGGGGEEVRVNEFVVWKDWEDGDYVYYYFIINNIFSFNIGLVYYFEKKKWDVGVFK